MLITEVSHIQGGNITGQGREGQGKTGELGHLHVVIEKIHAVRQLWKEMQHHLAKGKVSSGSCIEVKDGSVKGQ